MLYCAISCTAKSWIAAVRVDSVPFDTPSGLDSLRIETQEVLGTPVA